MAGAFADADGRGRLGELFDPSLVSRLKASHEAGAADCTARIHSLVFLERWLRKWA
jgi:hypothetical protein